MPAPMPQVDGVIVSTVPAQFVGYVMNTETGSITRYTQYPFHSLGEFNDTYLGASSTGIYALTGSTDDGANIAASSFKFGFSDFKSEFLKRIRDLYVGYRSDDDLQFTVTLDGEGSERTYTLARRGAGLRPARTKVGRGLKSRYWQIGISNTNGADFEIDTLDLLTQVLSRRI